MAEIKKDIKYINRDFAQFRTGLINFAKTYFSSTYNDFNESDPGMMFIEMSAWVGDVLSYYTDVNLKESFITHGEERANVYNHAIGRGYKPKNVIGASVDLEVYQLLPAKGSGTNVKPNFDYSLILQKDMVIKSELNSDVEFRTEEIIDYTFSSSYSTTAVTVYQTNDVTNEPTFYLLKKYVKANSGKVKDIQFGFTEPKEYDKVLINDTNIIRILSIIDSDGNTWYEVPYLAQDTVFESVENITANDPDYYMHRNSTPYLLKLIKTSRRFVTRFRADGKLEIQFGSGKSVDYDEELVPDPTLVGSALPGIINGVQSSFDPSNFLYTKTYGIAPSNTTLTISYLVGNSLKDNVRSGELTDITSYSHEFAGNNLDSGKMSTVLSSLSCVNKQPAAGAKNKEDIDEIVNNSLANFASQNRTVTGEDYVVRIYSMPAKYGAISKAYIAQDDMIYINRRDSGIVSNLLALNLYVLGYDHEGKLTTTNAAIKDNIKNYLSINRMLTDAVNIRDAFIVNIGVNFEVMTYTQFNSNEILLRCIDEMKKYFNIRQWQINQPILKSKVYTTLMGVEGVRAVNSITFNNLYNKDNGYSGNVYDLSIATEDGVVYPSMDPCIFEVKYPNKDIKGRVINY